MSSPNGRVHYQGLGMMMRKAIALVLALYGHAAIGAQTTANVFVDGEQSAPALAADGSGNLLVVWQSEGSPGSDEDGHSVQARFFDRSGSPKGEQFQVNTDVAGDQVYPAVAGSSWGSFVVVWTDVGHGIRGQLYETSGLAAGSQFVVTEAASAWKPMVAMREDGSFAVGWEQDADLDGSDLEVRFYDAQGSPIGEPFRDTDPCPDPSICPESRLDLHTIVPLADGFAVLVDFSSWNISLRPAQQGHNILGNRFTAEGVSVDTPLSLFGWQAPYNRAYRAIASNGDDLVVAEVDVRCTDLAFPETTRWSGRSRRLALDGTQVAVSPDFAEETFTTPSCLPAGAAVAAVERTGAWIMVVWDSPSVSDSTVVRFSRIGRQIGGREPLDETGAPVRNPRLIRQIGSEFAAVWERSDGEVALRTSVPEPGALVANIGGAMMLAGLAGIRRAMRSESGDAGGATARAA